MFSALFTSCLCRRVKGITQLAVSADTLKPEMYGGFALQSELAEVKYVMMQSGNHGASAASNQHPPFLGDLVCNVVDLLLANHSISLT